MEHSSSALQPVFQATVLSVAQTTHFSISVIECLLITSVDRTNTLSMKLWRKKKFTLVFLLPPTWKVTASACGKCLGKTEKALHFYEIFWERDCIHRASVPAVVDVVQSLSPAPFFATPRTAAHQAHLSFTISQSLLKLMSIESVILSNHLILCRPLLHLPSIIPSIRVFSNKSALCTRWPKY